MVPVTLSYVPLAAVGTLPRSRRLPAAFTENTEALSQVYNVAVGERTTLKALYSLIHEEVTARVHVVPAETVYRDFRPGDVRHSLADIPKARRLLRYNPRTRSGRGYGRRQPITLGCLQPETIAYLDCQPF